MPNLTAKISEIIEDLISIRGGVFIFGKMCLAVALIAGIDAGLTLGETIKGGSNLTALAIDMPKVAVQENQKKELKSYDIITARNIFGSNADVKNNPKPTAPTSSLKLRLVGTFIQKGLKPFAIVEDTAKKKQEVVEVDQKIFDRYKLLEVFAKSVRISHNDKTETLVMEVKGSSDLARGGTSTSGTVTSSEDGTEFSVSETELNNAMANLPRLLSQARAVPYFKNGQSIGMRLFAIRKGSLYEKLGLKNGDIIRSVNENSLTDPSQALKIFEELKTERSISLVLERKGQDKTLNYEIE